MVANTEQVKRVARYGSLGLVTAGLELAAFVVLDIVMHIYAASVVSFFVGLITSFLFNKFLVFKNTKKVTQKEVAQFATLGLANSQLSAIITWSIAFITPGYTAKIISIVFIAIWNYLIMNFIIFRKQDVSELLD